MNNTLDIKNFLERFDLILQQTMRNNASNIDEISSIINYELFAKVLMKMAVKAARIRKSGEIERETFSI